MMRGEIWLINLSPSTGAEITKTRPAIIVNDDAMGRLPLKITVPLTEWKVHFSSVPWMVHVIEDALNGLDKESAADAFQIRSISQERFVRKLGIASEAVMAKLAKAMAIVLRISVKE